MSRVAYDHHEGSQPAGEEKATVEESLNRHEMSGTTGRGCPAPLQIGRGTAEH